MKFSIQCLRALAPLFAIAVLFELPSFDLAAPRLNAELLLLLALWIAGLHARPSAAHVLARFWLALGVALFCVDLDRALFRRFMGEEPLLYDQLFMLRHLLVLLSDVFSPQLIAAALGGLLGCAAATWLVRALLARAALQLTAAGPRASLACAATLAVLALAGDPWVRSVTPVLRDNLARSLAIYRSVQHSIEQPTHGQRQGAQLTRTPDVYLVLVESYGRVLAEHPALRVRYLDRIRAMQRALTQGGWHAVSAYSRAPVMGGRSWLAEASVLTGREVRYEAVFRQLVEQSAHVDNLVSFLAARGYRSILLAPADRRRRGVEEVNYWGYQRNVRLTDLAYRGPRYGWGIVPDQYSLAYTATHVLAHEPQPRFLNYHMVSSHAPWDAPPQLFDDWRALSDGRGRAPEEIDDSVASRLTRYLDKRVRFADEGTLDDGIASRYLTTILYDLDVLQRHLLALHDDALIVILGDHQPPFIAAETKSFDTPVHVLARDAQLLFEWSAAGFQSGLEPAGGPARLSHEQLFPLFVRSLTQCCSKAERESPQSHAPARRGS